RLQRADDAGLIYRHLLTVFARLDASCGDRPGAARGDEHLPLDSLRILEAEPDPITESARIERTRARCIEGQLLIAHVKQHIQHALEDARENCEPVCAVPGE